MKPSETTGMQWVASKMTHAKPIQTTIVFAWVFASTLAIIPEPLCKIALYRHHD